MNDDKYRKELEARIVAKRQYKFDVEREIKEADDYISVHRETLPVGVITMVLEGMYQRRGVLTMLQNEISELEYHLRRLIEGA